MSWDVSIMKFSHQYALVEAISDGESCLPLGARVEVHSAVSDWFPGTDWRDPNWGIWDSQFGSIEFNLGEDEPATGLMLHIRADNAVIQPIIALCRHRGWIALDCSTGEFLEQAVDPTAGLEAWRTFRDSVIN